MTPHVNRTELTGNLGNAPEARFTAAGTLIATASLAVHSSYKQGEEWKERTDWFRLVAFGEAAEALSRFAKGERIAVTGRLQTSSYTDREGQPRTSVELVVLRSDAAPLARRAPAEPAPEAPAEAEVIAEPPPPAPPASKPRRRAKAAA